MTTLLDTLTSYVPALITRRLAAAPSSLTAPLAERFPAAVLFADISGFTALTERLAQRGLPGVEELSRLLNDYFGQLIALITEHGGDVVKFAGDALLAVWLAEDSLPTATLQAAQCGLAVQAKLHNYATAEGVSLSMRLGIGAGEVSVVHVGGVFERWEFVLGGAPIVQVSLAEGHAQPGEVILSPEAWNLVQDRVAVERRKAADGTEAVRLNGVHAPSPLHVTVHPFLDTRAEPALRAYIPSAILARVAAGQTVYLSELRRVTVLFINLPGFGQNTELERAQTVMRALQTALYHYEGSINKLNVDDKGVTLVAAYGLPPLAHEDDATRGTLAALEAHAKLSELDVRHAIGVTTGRAFCGAVGGEARREYTLIGDVVNLSARLMQAAGRALAAGGQSPGAEGFAPLLCDEATFQSAQARVAFETLPPVAVKGKAEPVAIHRPLREKKVVEQSQTEMVGRAQERTALSEAMQALRRGETAGAVVIEGEAGLGKSRLVDAAQRQAQALGLPVLIGAGDAFEKSTPYYAWRAIFTQLLDLSLFTTPKDKRQFILDLLEDQPEMRERAPLLDLVLALEWDDNEFTAQMPPQVRADNRRDLLLQFLKDSARRSPRVLIIEDAHWLDSASWALAYETSRSVEGMLMVLATRPLSEPVPHEYTRLRERPTTTHLRLEPLPAEDIQMLVCQRLGLDTSRSVALPEPVAALIREKAEGNPFFTEELAYALRDAGVLQIVNGECQVASGVDWRAITFPDTVQGVVAGRIDRLTPQQQLTLKVASVVGRVFALRVLRDIHPIEADKSRLTDYLTAMDSLDITLLDTPEPDLAYLFKHVITQEVAYNLMLFSQRRDLHRAVAEWYEQTFAADLSPYYPFLAHHWSRAEDLPRAIDYLEKSGEQALNNYANQEAVRFLTEALSLEARSEPRLSPIRRAHWERMLGEGCMGLGQLTEARTHFERALALQGRLIPSGQVRLALTLGGLVLEQFLYRVLPGVFLKPPKESGPDGRGALIDAVLAHEHAAEIYIFLQIPNTLLLVGHAALQTVNLAERAGPSPELARAYATISIAAGINAMHALADYYGRLALETARHVQSLSAQNWVLFITGIYRMGLGQWAGVQEAFDQSLALCERLGDQYRWAQTKSNMAHMLYYRGEFAQSLGIAEELHSAARRSNDPRPLAWALYTLAENCLRLGRFDEAVNYLERCLPLYATSPDRLTEPLPYGLLAMAHLRRGELELARQAADRAAELITGIPSPVFVLCESHAGIVETRLALWERALTDGQPRFAARALQSRARQACHALQTFARTYTFCQPRMWLLQGEYERLAGHVPKALRAWQKGLTTAESLRMSYDEGLAHYFLGCYVAGADRERHLRQAVEILERLGAVYDLERARAALHSA